MVNRLTDVFDANSDDICIPRTSIATAHKNFPFGQIFASPSLSRGGATIASPLRGLADGFRRRFSRKSQSSEAELRLHHRSAV